MKSPHPPLNRSSPGSSALVGPSHAPSGQKPDGAPSAEGRWWLRVLVAAVLVGGAVFALTHWGWHGIRDGLMQLHPALVLVFMAVLPVFGFSVAATYFLAGARFGIWWGGAAIAGVTAFHLLASHFVARAFFRKWVEGLLAKNRHRVPRIPPGENASLSAMIALVPGLPYFIRNYALALSEVPLRTYFWICLPIYVARSYVTLALGDLGSELTVKKAAILAGVLGVKLAICTYLLFRIRRRIKDLPTAES